MNKKINRVGIEHVLRMTTDVGIWEHCNFAMPNPREGYSIDDNARALQLSLRIKGLPQETYLSFLLKASREKGFHNDLNDSLQWDDQAKTGEHFGRAMEALAECAVKGNEELRAPSALVFDQKSPLLDKRASLRTQVHLICAIVYRLEFEKNKGKSQEIWEQMQKFSKMDNRIFGIHPHLPEVAIKLADTMVERFKTISDSGWQWFEESLTYDNARLPLGLFRAYQLTGNKTYLSIAEKSLDFLISQMWDSDYKCFSFVGNKGWFKQNEKKAVFDQQPIEAASMVETCIAAWEITKKQKYLDYANLAFEWYWGKNILGIGMVDQNTYGVYNALVESGYNPDQGAEAIVTYLLAQEELFLHDTYKV